jgi:hypothetical protein
MDEEPLSSVERQQIDDIATRFGVALDDGTEPAIEEFLAKCLSDSSRPALFRELLTEELSWYVRRKGWELSSALRDAYVVRFAKYEAVVDFVFTELSGIARSTAQVSAADTAAPVGGPLINRDRYQLERKLGSGGFGVVWLVTDLLTSTQAAIKVLKVEDQRERERLLNEAVLASRLAHEGIVSVRHVDLTSDKYPYIVMDHVSGGDMRRRIVAEPTDEDIQRFVRVVMRVAEALQYLHSKGVNHFDLKPENILLDAASNTPKIADFGLAIHFSRRTGHEDTRAGTYPYMSPEMYNSGREGCDGRADIWSLGVILFELLTGQTPFCGSDWDSWRNQICHVPAPQPRERNPKIPQRLATVCLRCLEKDRDRRFQSASDVAEALAAALRKTSDAHRRVEAAQELMRDGKRDEAIKAMKEGLALARETGDEQEEVEVLVGLALLSSDRRGHGDRQHYFQQAEKRISKLKSNAARAIYHRARAAALEEKKDMAGAEQAYLDALKCCASTEDEKGNLATQGCIIRSSFVHHLCNAKRLDEAQPLLAECEEYARQHKDAEEGELFQAALEAGIHFALEAADEDGAIMRIKELEEYVDTARLANRIGGDLINVANQASHRKAHRAALAAAESGIRLARRCEGDNADDFLAGALYTEAAVLLHAGDDKKALEKAQAVLDLCNRPEVSIIKQATHHLIAEVRRCAGDPETAVELSRRALSAATGRPEDVAFTKAALAKALSDNGQTEEAYRQAREAWTLVRPVGIPPRAALEFLSQITNYGSQIGEDIDDAIKEIGHLRDENDDVKADKDRALARATANRLLRGRFIDVFKIREPDKVARVPACSSLPEANAAVVKPLLELWKELPDYTYAGIYDFWGRGNFARMLLNTHSFPSSFNVTLEVRNLEDVKRAIRLWGMYADFLILLWKGETKSGLSIIPFAADYKEAGGWGYAVCGGDVLTVEGSARIWHPAIAHHSVFPNEVALFLATEARSFLKSGRIVIVPAVAAGCISPGHGPFEQLLAEAANALPSVRWNGFQGAPIGLIPHSPTAPFELLSEIVEAEADRLRKLRLLLLKRSRELNPDGDIGMEARTLTLEIDDALRDLEGRNNAFARKKGLATAKEPIAGATARFRTSGRKLAGKPSDSPFAPLLILQSHGYGWRVDEPEIPKCPPRFEPQGHDIIGTWLAPPSRGWSRPRAVSSTHRGGTIKTGDKTGRNDPCPCGSGQKYKKCCGS